MSDAAQPKGEEGMGAPPENTATAQPTPALAREPNILELFARDLRLCGVVGELRIAKLVYLAATSRFFNRPVSMVVKGPSSGGKSFTVTQVLRFFPSSAYYELTSMSEKALAYIDEDLRHRVIVIYEAAGMAGQFATYLMRTLLSEGQISHQTVEPTKEGLRPRRLHVEGPVGLLVTTTRAHLHPENETRMLSVTVNDTPEHTRSVFHALAGKRDQTEDQLPELAPWVELQKWLPNHEVVIPYARKLADLVSNESTRLRRDFERLLSLIGAHAILHQASRECDQGRIVATLEDYAAVRDLVADQMAEGVEAAVPHIVRETVNAVAALHVDSPEGVTVVEVAKYLGLDKSSALRRVQVAILAGYLGDNESRKGRPKRLCLGDPMPEDREVLPSVERLRGCSENEGVYPGPGAASASAPEDDAEVIQ